MIQGKNILGYSLEGEGKVVLKAREASNQHELPENFVAATPHEVDVAAQLAARVFPIFSKTDPENRARFLETIASEIEHLGDELLQRASSETGLPLARFEGERGRTCGQLRLFAKVVREGSWVEATIDTADADRTPLPKPDVRKMLVGVGPVLVFTASNFPLAFSTAGGDTASALAAGCPVIVKAHESHLGTNELVARAIQRAAQKTGMPEGVFSSLNGDGLKTGNFLINHPKIKSVAFTGSFRGGMALHKIAQERKEPIPVFAEMGSINPVIACAEALKSKGEDLAQKYAAAITLGVGQFCTNPGLLIGISSPELDNFKLQLSAQLDEVAEGTMLNQSISSSFSNGKEKTLAQDGVSCATRKSQASTLAVTTGQNFVANPQLHEEVFGPLSLLVECADEEELLAVVDGLQGQLTGTILAEDADQVFAEKAAILLQEKVGRIIWNGVPTGVEVCHAMHHGGPFPATTDSRFTSVGTSAIKRFARPVSFQDFPQSLLPGELKDGNDLNILRKVDGEWKR